MSRRSFDSTSDGKGRTRVTDDEVFNYVLRVALLSFIMTPKPAEPIPAVVNGGEKEHTTRISDAISNSIFSLGDLFKDSRDGSKTVKFPERLLKVLEQRLQNIAMGKDATYSDQLIRRTFAAFYGISTQDTFKKQMKDNRNIEELILKYAATATGILKRDPQLTGDAWKLELNKHISMFVRMLRDSLKGLHHVQPELTSRLDMYVTKLAPPSTDSGYDSSSSTSKKSNRDSEYVTVGPSFNVSDMDLVRTVANLFQLDLQEIQTHVNQLRQVCTEKAALLDLKTCMKNIASGVPFPAHREDFESDEAWQRWRTTELSTLSQLIVIMIKVNPELAKSAPSEAPSTPATSARHASVSSLSLGFSPLPMSRHGSVSSRASLAIQSTHDFDADLMHEQINEDEEVKAGQNFTYIPPNPRKFYKRLLEICIQADLDAMANLPEDQEVSLGILSQRHLDLINECAVRWRIGQPYRVACFMDVIKYKYEREEVPMECVPEGLQIISKTMHDIDVPNWPRQDTEYLSTIYAGLFTIFLSSLFHTLERLPALKPSDVGPYLLILEQLRDSGLLETFEVDISTRIGTLKDRVKAVSVHVYSEQSNELFSAPGVNRALPLLLITDFIEKNAKLLDKRFPEPLLGELDLVSLMLESQIPMFLSDLEANQKRLFESSMNGPTPDIPIEDIFSLFRRTQTLLAMYQAFVPQIPLDYNVVAFFQPYVLRWLQNTDAKTAQWVQNAITADKFEPEEAGGHSSSIVDLFDSLRSPITFLQDLQWTDEYQEARFFTSLSKTISQAVEQYCRSIESKFMAEMFPRPTEFLQPQKQSAWLEKAKQLAAVGEKRVQPFNFQPQSCVKLNNIDAARRLLDNMYGQMQVDKVSEVLEQHAPPVPDKQERQRFLFAVKICIAEGLVPLDASPSAKLDTFVTLSDEAGNRLAKTRTIYEKLDPRWDETFDISVDKPLWLMVSVRDRALVGKHDTIGRAYICLDPRRFGDLLTHDIWSDLDTSGRILLRVSMEGEKDDIQFYFGRAFRSLKRAEADMVRIFIDKMSPFIQQSLSRSVLKTLMRSNSTLDYNKAIGNVTNFYKSTFGNSAAEVQIPLPQSEKPRLRPEELTDVEIERAIVPLFDYFETNLQVLNQALSETTKEMVMTRVWKEILTVIEGLLVPPLSDAASEMKPLMDKEVDIVFKWLKFLRDYFYAGGEGLPREALENQKYRDVVSIRLYYDWDTDALMEECVRMMQQNLSHAPTVKKRAKTVYSQRNLGTIKDRKREKREQKEVTNGETIMRILRMRQGTMEFIAQQMRIMASVQVEQEQRARELAQRRVGRPGSLSASGRGGLAGMGGGMGGGGAFGGGLGQVNEEEEGGVSLIPPVPALPQVQ